MLPHANLGCHCGSLVHLGCFLDWMTHGSMKCPSGCGMDSAVASELLNALAQGGFEYPTAKNLTWRECAERLAEQRRPRIEPVLFSLALRSSQPSSEVDQHASTSQQAQPSVSNMPSNPDTSAQNDEAGGSRHCILPSALARKRGNPLPSPPSSAGKRQGRLPILRNLSPSEFKRLLQQQQQQQVHSGNENSERLELLLQRNLVHLELGSSRTWFILNTIARTWFILNTIARTPSLKHQLGYIRTHLGSPTLHRPEHSDHPSTMRVVRKPTTTFQPPKITAKHYLITAVASFFIGVYVWHPYIEKWAMADPEMRKKIPGYQQEQQEQQEQQQSASSPPA
ncbi:uncharacterized protein BJ171DRAFT_476691 [Polychytrium aggregatum]|uniref:uncharacterized protein n=1 Tax=Polychytrium aggregatum TaxID=110093 RepID=UPI0022FDD76F|nr:uncharacterized protein BJ171DRAFT_476691 [Polychytrium aggregatum]KAI9202487.1 hypothetical protein BJ171DRAFT_476691 [Polychytrium aggregatum]